MIDLTVPCEFVGLEVPDHPDNIEVIGAILDCALGFAAAHFDQFRAFSTGLETGDTSPAPSIVALFSGLSAGAMRTLMDARYRSYDV